MRLLGGRAETQKALDVREGFTRECVRQLVGQALGPLRGRAEHLLAMLARERRPHMIPKIDWLSSPGGLIPSQQE